MLQGLIHCDESFPFFIVKKFELFNCLTHGVDVFEELTEAAIRRIPHIIDFRLILSKLIIFIFYYRLVGLLSLILILYHQFVLFDFVSKLLKLQLILDTLIV